MNTWKDLLLAGIAVLLLSACSSDDEENSPIVDPVEETYQDPMFEDFECYPQGTVWQEYDGYMEGYNPDFGIMYRFEVKGDTTIQGIDYKRVIAQLVQRDTIYNSNDRDAYIERDREESYTFAIREDKGRIYKWNAEYAKDALFYNFNWKEGLQHFVYNEVTDEYLTSESSIYDVFGKVKMENGEVYDSYGGQIKTIGMIGWGGLFSSYPSGTLGIGIHRLFSFTRNGQLLYLDRELIRLYQN